MLAGMASTMAQGFAFGTGSSIAHRYSSHYIYSSYINIYLERERELGVFLLLFQVFVF